MWKRVSRNNRGPKEFTADSEAKLPFGGLASGCWDPIVHAGWLPDSRSPQCRGPEPHATQLHIGCRGTLVALSGGLGLTCSHETPSQLSLSPHSFLG